MHFSLCETILDLVQNSIEAGADKIKLNLTESDSVFVMELEDNGCGMTEEEMQRAMDPFYTDGVKHKERKVGLGLPFLQQQLEMTEGDFQLRSRKNQGTVLHARFNLKHIDTPPVGDVASLFLQAFCFEGSYQMKIQRESTKGSLEYQLDRLELMDILGDFSDSQSMLLLRDYIRSQEQ